MYWQLVRSIYSNFIIVMQYNHDSVTINEIMFLIQNDIWQTQSWSSLEWSGQWKLLHYYIRRTYNHTLVSPLYVDGRVSIYVVVDVVNYNITYDLQVEVITWASVNIKKILQRYAVHISMTIIIL